MRTTPTVRSAAETALDALKFRIPRLEDAGALNGCSVAEATLHFHAVCEGLAGLELRNTFAADVGHRLWRQSLNATVHGLTRP